MFLLAIGEEQRERCAVRNSTHVPSEFDFDISLVSPVRTPEIFGSPERSSVFNSVANNKQSKVTLIRPFATSFREDATQIVFEVISHNVSGSNWAFESNGLLHLVLISKLDGIFTKRNVARSPSRIVFAFFLSIYEGVVLISHNSSSISDVSEG